jgi:hypothetical protein
MVDISLKDNSVDCAYLWMAHGEENRTPQQLTANIKKRKKIVPEFLDISLISRRLSNPRNRNLQDSRSSDHFVLHYRAV